MTCANVQFNRLDRGYSRDLVLIPGWATDVRIFEPLLLPGTSTPKDSGNPASTTSPTVIPAKAGIHLSDVAGDDVKNNLLHNPRLPYNCILPSHITPETFADDLHHWLDENSLHCISLLGWSMGGFLAANFAKHFPSQVNELFLISVRNRFDAQGLADIKTVLEKDRRAYLYGFYMQCLRHCASDHISRFKRSLLKSYIETMTLEDILNGLNYLADAKIDTAALSTIPTIRFFHGDLDEITPIAEAQNLASAVPNASFQNFPNLGHIVFYDPAFGEGFNG